MIEYRFVPGDQDADDETQLWSGDQQLCVSVRHCGPGLGGGYQVKQYGADASGIYSRDCGHFSLLPQACAQAGMEISKLYFSESPVVMPADAS